MVSNGLHQTPLLLGFTWPNEQFHAPNEHFHLSNFRRGPKPLRGFRIIMEGRERTHRRERVTVIAIGRTAWSYGHVPAPFGAIKLTMNERHGVLEAHVGGKGDVSWLMCNISCW